MVVDIVVWGLAAGQLLKPVVEELVTDATKDWFKDMFKGSLSNVLKLPEKEPLEKCAKKAIGEFLKEFTEQLQDADLDENQVKEYIEPVKRFLKLKQVRETLGNPLQPEVNSLDVSFLANLWQTDHLKELPDDFDWSRLGKRYVRKVKGIIQQDEQLSQILDSENLARIAEGREIKTDFSLIKYQETIQERYKHLPLDGLDHSIQDRRLPLWSVFIIQNVRQCQEYLPKVYELPKEYQDKLRQNGQLAEYTQARIEELEKVYSNQVSKSVLEVIEDDKKNHYLVILGDPGSGKSTLLKYLAIKWTQLPLKELTVKPIPLLIELRDYAQSLAKGVCHNFLEFIHKSPNWVGHLNQHELDENLTKGNALVMFDGLDEVFDIQQRKTIIKQIHDLTQDYPRIKVIVTSRVIGYDNQALRDASFSHYMIQDFDDTQIRKFSKKWHSLTSDNQQDKQKYQRKLKEGIENYKAIRELAGNPLLLTMMAILNRSQELPRDRAELYHQCSRILLYQWDVNRALIEDSRVDHKTFDYKDKQAMCRQIAYCMQSNKNGLAVNIISEDNLEKLLREYLKSLDVTNSREIAKVMIHQLRHRNFMLCSLGVIGQEGHYGFVHRTFLEYFCAVAFIEKFNKRGKKGGLTIEQLQEEVFGKHWDDQNWHEVLKLIAGQLDEFIENIVSYLIDIYDENKNKNTLILASECLDEVDNKFELTEVKNRLLDKLKDVLENFLNIKLELGEHKKTRQVVKNIILHWQDSHEVIEWLNDIALTHDYDWVRREVAKGMAEILLPDINNNLINDIADIYYYQKDYEKALNTYFRFSNEKTPYGFNLRIGNTYRALKRYDEAIHHYQIWIEKSPHDINAHNHLGYVYLEERKYDEALKSFNNGLEALEKYYGQVITADDFTDIAMTYLCWGKPNLATKTLTEATPKINSSKIYRYLGWAYHDLGEYDKALETYQDGLKINPEDHVICNNMAYLYFTLGKVEEAIESLEKSIYINYYSNYHGNLGIIYLAKNDLINAENELNIAIELEPDFGLAIFNFGTFYALKGDLETAKKKWQEGLRVYPGYRQEERLYATLYTIALGEKEQGLTNLQTILRDEQPPKGMLTQVLQIASILEKCPNIEGIKTAITMIKNEINDSLIIPN